MKMTPVIDHLRSSCPAFASRIGGAINLDALKASSEFSKPCAFIVSTGSKAGENDLQNEVRQDISDTFDIVVVLDPGTSTAQALTDTLDDMRSELWLALVGWKPSPSCDPILFVSEELIEADATRILYRYSFITGFQLGRTISTDPAETWHERELDELPEFEGLNVFVDDLDSAAGPEAFFEIVLTEELSA